MTFESKKNKQHGRGKNGIPRLDSDSDFLKAFSPENDDQEPTNANIDHPPPLKPEQNVKTALKTNKNGVPIIDSQESIEELLGTCVDNQNDSAHLTPEIPQNISQNRRDKNGIPILEKGEDISAVFSDSTDTPPSFSSIISETLGEKSQEVLLKEKKDSLGPQKKLTYEQRIHRYPKPQSHLDLHGYTSLKAALAAEIYLNNAFKKGLFTVQIIVGKGRHSENGPVLPDVIEHQVIEMKKKGVVLGYNWDKKRKSKSGAIIVFLNQFDLPIE